MNHSQETNPKKTKAVEIRRDQNTCIQDDSENTGCLPNNGLSSEVIETVNGPVHELETAISYHFNERTPLYCALTHSTYAYECKKKQIRDNERLEFLGDGVLDLIVGDLLYRDPVEYKEGVMSKTRALLVCETTLSNIARNIGLGKCLILGKGEEQTNGRDKNSNLSNAMESVIAAVYLDGGYEAAYRLVKELFTPLIEKAKNGQIIYDYKSKLLEYVQGLHKQDHISINIVKEEGPDHDRTFFGQVVYFNVIIGSGTGSTKKEAEQEAAREALEHIKTIDDTEQVTERFSHES